MKIETRLPFLRGPFLQSRGRRPSVLQIFRTLRVPKLRNPRVSKPSNVEKVNERSDALASQFVSLFVIVRIFVRVSKEASKRHIMHRLKAEIPASSLITFSPWQGISFDETSGEQWQPRPSQGSRNKLFFFSSRT